MLDDEDAARQGRHEAPAKAARDDSPDLDRLLDRAWTELARLEPGLPARFTFMWRGIDFTTRVEPTSESVRLTVEADLGAVPFSAEDRAARAKLLALARAQDPGAKSRYHISRDQRLRFSIETVMAAPAGAAAIVGRTAQLLFQARPHLEIAAPHCVNGTHAFPAPDPAR